MSKLVDESKYEQLLNPLRGWVIEDSLLTKQFQFSGYLDGVAFAKKCGELAEEMNHHPDLLIQWRKVTVSITTHSAGGLTGLDFEYAGKVEKGTAI